MPEEGRASGGIWRFGSGFDDAEVGPVVPEYTAPRTSDLPADDASATAGHRPPSLTAGVDAGSKSWDEASPVSPIAHAPTRGSRPLVEADEKAIDWLLPPAAFEDQISSAPEPPQNQAQEKRSRFSALVVGVLFLGLAAGGGIGWAMTRSSEDPVGTVRSGSVGGTQPGMSQATAQPADPPPTSPPPDNPPSPSPAPSTSSLERVESEALQTMEQLADEGLANHELDRRWVAQIASKWVGIKDPLQRTGSGSHTFAATDVLAEHLSLKNGDNLGADVFLLRSTDFGIGYRSHRKVVWTTFADGGFDSRDEAEDWCASRFPGMTGTRLANQCLPNRLRPLGG